MPSTRPSASFLAAILGLLVTLTPMPARAVEVPSGLLATHAGERGLSWDEAVQELVRADVVFLGEQHDDAATHRLERALLEALHEQAGKRLILSLEMFERDVQSVLDAYLQGRIPEAEFLAQSRPWPNYITDYRPLVEYAKAHGIPVLAANVPRRLASRVAKEGLEALDTLTPEERPWAALDVDVPKDGLWERFRASMEGHPGIDESQIARMYEAQCLKDATMAMAIAQAFEREEQSPRVLHVNGAFHSDEGLGVPAQLKRQAPALRQRVTTVLPVEFPPDRLAEGLADIVFVVTREQR